MDELLHALAEGSIVGGELLLGGDVGELMVSRSRVGFYNERGVDVCQRHVIRRAFPAIVWPAT